MKRGGDVEASLAGHEAPGDRQRLAALERAGILDTPPEQAFDDLVRLTASLLDAPIAAVGLIASDRQWLKAETGFGRREIPLEAAICVHALPHRNGLVIPDLTRDPRFVDNPMVTGTPGLRFYAGALLRTADGFPLGTLFVLDTRPRPEGLNAHEHFILDTLARQAMIGIEHSTLLRGQLHTRRLERDLAGRTLDRDRMWRLSTDIMMVLGPRRVIRAVNPAWTALLGWSEAELIGSNALALLHPDDKAIALLQVQADPGEVLPPRRFETRVRHRDGSYRWIRWAAVPEVGALHAVGRDVTAEKEQAEALRQVGDELRQSQKMEAVGQLTGGLAHDFNNLLTGISGSLDLLQIRAAQGRMGELDHHVAAARDATGRAASLTHRLLAFSRRQTLDPKPTRINALVTGIEALIRRTMGSATVVKVMLAEDLGLVLCDQNQLENALLNLCINARDAMPEGGRLTIVTANLTIDASCADAAELPAGRYVTLDVIDTGAGMTPEVVAQAFDPFFTTKPVGQGTGLGLSMIEGFARQFGGHVRITSQPGKGTTMRICLPRHPGEVASELVVTGQISSAPAVVAPAVIVQAVSGETILIVDDEPIVRMLISEVLEELGYIVIEASSAASGLNLLQSGARIDLLITDVGLPGAMNGRQMAEAALVQRPGLRILFVTGYTDDAALDQARLPANMQILTKPFTLDVLASRLVALMAG